VAVRAVQQIVDGLATGSIYGALALALVLAHRATGVVNFAQGQMAVVSTFVAWSLTRSGLGVIAAIAVAVAFSLVFGAAVERLVMRRFERESPLIAVVATVGLLLLLNGVSSLIWGYDLKAFPPVFSSGTLRAGGAAVSITALGTFLVLVAAVLALYVLMMRTRLGLALRAVADNPDSSALSGLPVGHLLMVGWGLAAGLGAIAGCLVAPKLYLDPNMLAGVLVYALAAAVFGGFDSPLGAVVAAWIIGVSENLAATYIDVIGNDLRIAVPLLLTVLVLLLRPQGLFGRREVVRV
jgi:branched-chain amino acid transport system permease protein